jgi:hypothetical protein
VFVGEDDIPGKDVAKIVKQLLPVGVVIGVPLADFV